jgi:hypothetical protein
LTSIPTYIPLLHKALRRLLFLGCLLASLLQPAATQAQQPEVQQLDSSEVTVRSFSRSTIDSLRKLKDFDYTIRKEKKKSWLRRVLEWLFNDVLTFSDKQGRTSVGHVIGWIAVGIIVIFVILQLVGISPVKLFRGNTKTIRYEITEEELHGTNYEAAIAEAVGRGDYRVAIRLHYLQMLSMLADQQLIDWRIDKTNHHYETELRKTPHYDNFCQLTYIYEAAWYGELNTSRTLYDRVGGLFITAKKKIQP